MGYESASDHPRRHSQSMGMSEGLWGLPIHCIQGLNIPADQCMEPSQHLFWKRTLLVSPEGLSSSNVFSWFACGVLQDDMPKNGNPNLYVIDDPVPEKGDWKNPIKTKWKLKQEIVNWVANCVTKLNTRVSKLACPYESSCACKLGKGRMKCFLRLCGCFEVCTHLLASKLYWNF
jgi:hypothetical protein